MSEKGEISMSHLRSFAAIWIAVFSSAWTIGIGIKMAIEVSESVLPLFDYVDASFSVLAGSILLSIFLKRWKNF